MPRVMQTWHVRRPQSDNRDRRLSSSHDHNDLLLKELQDVFENSSAHNRNSDIALIALQTPMESQNTIYADPTVLAAASPVLAVILGNCADSEKVLLDLSFKTLRDLVALCHGLEPLDNSNELKDWLSILKVRSIEMSSNPRSSYSCQFCGRNDIEEILNHLENHRSEIISTIVHVVSTKKTLTEDFVCPGCCQKIFASRIPDLNYLKCHSDLCAKKIREEENRLVPKSNKPHNLQCQICNKSFKTNFALKKHKEKCCHTLELNSTTPPRQTERPRDLISTLNKSSVSEENQTCLLQENKCAACDRDFRFKHQLKEHLITSHFKITMLECLNSPSFPISCACRQELRDESSLLFHLGLEHGLLDQIMKGDKNEKIVNLAHELFGDTSKRQYVIKPGDSQTVGNICHLCPKSFPSISYLRRHMYESHFGRSKVNEYITKYTSANLDNVTSCFWKNDENVCNQTFSKRETLLRHIATIHKVVDELLEKEFGVKIASAKKWPFLMDYRKQKKPSPSKEVNVQIPSAVSELQPGAENSSNNQNSVRLQDGIYCSHCNEPFATKELKKLHTCESIIDRNGIADENKTRNRKQALHQSPAPKRQRIESGKINEDTGLRNDESISDDEFFGEISSESDETCSETEFASNNHEISIPPIHNEIDEDQEANDGFHCKVCLERFPSVSLLDQHFKVSGHHTKFSSKSSAMTDPW